MLTYIDNIPQIPNTTHPHVKNIWQMFMQNDIIVKACISWILLILVLFKTCKHILDLQNFTDSHTFTILAPLQLSQNL